MNSETKERQSGFRDEFLRIRTVYELCGLLQTDLRRLNLMVRQPRYKSFTVPKRNGDKGKAWFIPRFNDWLQAEMRFLNRQAARRNQIYALAGLLARRIRALEPDTLSGNPENAGDVPF